MPLSFYRLPVSDLGLTYRVVVTDLDGVLSGYTMTTDPSALQVLLTTANPDVPTADAGYSKTPTFAFVSSIQAYPTTAAS